MALALLPFGFLRSRRISLKMQATTLLHLSNELLVMIVDHISTSYPSAKNLVYCSLVCRRLRSPAQRKLFKNVRLLTNRRIETLLELIRANPSIATYIRVIVASSHWPFIVDTEDGLNMPLAPILLRIQELSPYTSITLKIFQLSNKLAAEEIPVNYVTINDMHSALSRLIMLEIEGADIPMVAFSGHGQLKRLGFNEARCTNLKSEDILQLPMPLLCSVTDIYVGYTQDFPGVLIANCPSLRSLFLESVHFEEDFVELGERDLPQIQSLNVSDFDFQTIEMLVDSFVDVSLLKQLLDSTVMTVLEDYAIEECLEVADATRYILDRSKNTLEHLCMHCSKPFLFSNLNLLPATDHIF